MDVEDVDLGAVATSGETLCGWIANDVTEDMVTAARASAVAHTEDTHDLIVVLYCICLEPLLLE